MSAPGRIRCKLAETLSVCLSASMLGTQSPWGGSARPRTTHKVTCNPNDLWPARGAWRTNMMLDVMPWGGQVICRTTYWHTDRPVERHSSLIGVCSWETMTDLCRAMAIGVDYDCGYELGSVALNPFEAAKTARRMAGWRRRLEDRIRDPLYLREDPR